MAPRSQVPDPDALHITVSVDGEPVHRNSTVGLIRPVARLLAAVTDFMTLRPGDLLSVGVAAGAPRVCAGQRVTIDIEGIGQLDNSFVAETLA